MQNCQYHKLGLKLHGPDLLMSSGLTFGGSSFCNHLSPQKFYGPWSQVSCREFRDNIPVAGIHVPCAVVQSKELSAGHSYFARSVSKPTSSSQSYFVRRDAVSNRTEDPKCASVAPHCPPTPHVPINKSSPASESEEAPARCCLGNTCLPYP